MISGERIGHKGTTNYSLPQNVCRQVSYWLRGWFHQLAGGKCIQSHHLNLPKMVAEIVHFIVFKEMDFIMHVALTAHHTPALMSHISASCISLGLSADQ
jgi:hypothetical protein